MFDRIRQMFAPQVTITTTTRDMTPEEVEALGAAFDRVEEAFAEADKAFRVFARVRDGKP